MYKPLDESLVTRIRVSSNRYDPDLQLLVDTKEDWSRYHQLDEFPAGSGKVSQARQGLTSKWSNRAEVAGFTFKTLRSADGSKELLAVRYDPELIEDGAWERFQQEKSAKAKIAKAKADAKKAKK